MRVREVICAEGRSGYMHRDLLAIKSGKAKPNGSLYEGEPMSRALVPAVPVAAFSARNEPRRG